MHARIEELALYLLGRLPEQQAEAIRGHVENCSACGEKLGETRGFLEKSAKLKAGAFPEQGKQTAWIKRIYPTVSEPLSGCVWNISKDDLKMEVSQTLEPGTTIEILMEGTIAIAEVRDCIRVGEAYHAGASIQNLFAKSGAPLH